MFLNRKHGPSDPINKDNYMSPQRIRMCSSHELQLQVETETRAQAFTILLLHFMHFLFCMYRYSYILYLSWNGWMKKWTDGTKFRTQMYENMKKRFHNFLIPCNSPILLIKAWALVGSHLLFFSFFTHYATVFIRLKLKFLNPRPSQTIRILS